MQDFLPVQIQIMVIFVFIPTNGLVEINVLGKQIFVNFELRIQCSTELILILGVIGVSTYYSFVSSKKGLVIFNHNCCEIGMKRCDNVCVDRHTPCHGICWDESSIHKCGDNMCLSQYQLQVIHSNLDIANKSVRSFLFTILNSSLYQM